MADLAKTLSTRNSSDENGKLLLPHYPVSTRNPAVPRVLAEVLDKKARMEHLRDDFPRSSSRGSRNGGEGVQGKSSGVGGGTGGTTAKQVHRRCCSGEICRSRQCAFIFAAASVNGERMLRQCSGCKYGNNMLRVRFKCGALLFSLFVVPGRSCEEWCTLLRFAGLTFPSLGLLWCVCSEHDEERATVQQCDVRSCAASQKRIAAARARYTAVEGIPFAFPGAHVLLDCIACNDRRLRVGNRGSN